MRPEASISDNRRNVLASPVPLQQIHRQRLQRDGFATENFQGFKGPAGEQLREFSGFLHSDDGWVGGLLRFGVFSRRLAELLAGLRDVEDVVDDLKGQADVVAEVRQGPE